MSSKSFKSSPLLREFRKAVQEVADSMVCHPRMVSTRQLYEFDNRKYRRLDHKVRREFSTYSAAMDMAFPPDRTPFYRYEELQLHELQELIGDLIRQCADAVGENPHEVTWDQFRRYIGHMYGHNDVGLCRYAITKAGTFPAVRDAIFKKLPTPITVNKFRTQEHARINRKLGREDAEVEFMLDRITAHAEKVFSKAYKIDICCKIAPQGEPIQELLLMLSDLHIGSDINAFETGVPGFGPVEEARRVARICREAVRLAGSARTKTRLRVVVNGDIIQGQLHDPRDGAVLAEQIERAQRILIQAITWLSAHFPATEVVFLAGNHDRFKEVHHKRAVAGKWNSILWVIGMSVKFAVEANSKTVKFTFPKTPYGILEIFGKRIYATHGDTVIDFGNVHKAISTSSWESQTSKINNSLGFHDIYLGGHVHKGTFLTFDNGSVVYTNGSITPAGPHAVSLGSFQSNCGQWILLFEKGQRDHRHQYVTTTGEDDKDETLDEIVQPWVELTNHDVTPWEGR